VTVLGVHGHVGDSAFVVEVEHEGLGGAQRPAVDPHRLAQFRHDDVAGGDDACDVHAVVGQARQRVGDERDVVTPALVLVAVRADAGDVSADAPGHSLPIVGDHRVEELGHDCDVPPVGHVCRVPTGQRVPVALAAVHDVVIRGGLVVDGTGAPATAGDVAVRDGRVVAVGPDVGAGRETIDADGAVVTPGFVDPHTHLDAQLCWDASASPTSLHGVTSVVIGLCGFGIAPCAEGGGDYLLRSLEMVEEIPFESTSKGVPFAWSSWPEFLHHLSRRRLAVNVAGYVPHSALRYAVMGERARGETATADDRAALVAELTRALEAGAIGFATSRGPNHNDAYGEPVPSRHADDAELRALVDACRGRVWQINVATKFSGDADGLRREVEQYVGWTRDAGARLTWSPCFAEPGDGVWQTVLAQNDDANVDVPVAPQVAPLPFMTTLRFDRPSVAAVISGWDQPLAGFFQLDPSERRARLAGDDLRSALRAAPEDCERMLAPCYAEWVFSRSASRPDLLGSTLAEAAARAGAHPVDFLCDLVVADDLATDVQVPIVNRDHDGRTELVSDEHTLVGLGDSGAHVMSVTNYTYPTYLLSRVVRDEELIPLPVAVERITRRPARFHGLADRGTLEPGAAADVCVIDLEHLRLGPLTVAHDLPGGASRLFQAGEGYAAVLVNGRIAICDDRAVDDPAGTVLRVV
jgi:N-acyl-D-amino-acid deacylase